MEQFLQIIEDYLDNKEANHAVLITGPWGCGKTFAFKNHITKIIEKKKKHRPIYVSLYGINNVDDISKKIFFEIYPWLGTKYLDKIKEFGTVGKFIATLGYGLQLPELKLNFKDLKKLDDNFVLCFDDLERVSLDIEEVLGYINNFIEHDNLKTIIIANEEEIISKQLKSKYEERLAQIQTLPEGNSQKRKEEEAYAETKRVFGDQIPYQKSKEKIIGITIKYRPILETSFADIVSIYKDKNNYSDSRIQLSSATGSRL